MVPDGSGDEMTFTSQLVVDRFALFPLRSKKSSRTVHRATYVILLPVQWDYAIVVLDGIVVLLFFSSENILQMPRLWSIV